MKKTFFVGFVLLVLWAASFGLSYIDLGRASLVVALGIAAVKAVIVVMIFMELAKERASVRFAAVSAVLMIGVLVSLVAVDIGMRAVPMLRPASDAVDVARGTGAPGR